MSDNEADHSPPALHEPASDQQLPPPTEPKPTSKDPSREDEAAGEAEEAGAAEVQGQQVGTDDVPSAAAGAMDTSAEEGSSEGSIVLEVGGEGMGGSGDTSASDESDDWTEGDNHEMKRVKVYELVGARWVDQGTAFCSGHFDENTNEAFLIARSEADYNNVILTTTIRSNDVYQRQQETLIVWTEPDGADYALSFQDPEGCAEVWNFILEVQRMMNDPNDQLVTSSPVIGPEPSITTTSIIRSGRLPLPQIGIVEDIDRAIKALARTPSLRERVVEHVQSEGYVKHMIDLYNQCEDLESLENLHALCGLMQTLLLLNDHTLFEHILDDELFFGVIGILEYDPEFPSYKANYREFLTSTTQFHQPVTIRDPAIQRKVHHTYRLQFLKDVVLARAIDDATFNVLNSCIVFNQIDIINYVQNDPYFLRDVVKLFVEGDMADIVGPPPPTITKTAEGVTVKTEPNGTNGLSSAPDETTSEPLSPEAEAQRRREVILLVQHLCAMGKNVQLPQRMALFRTLVDRGVLCAVQWALSCSEREEHGRAMVTAGGEILSTLLDHDLNGVRGHVVKQVQAAERRRAAATAAGGANANAALQGPVETVLLVVCRIMAASRDLAIQSLVGDALKVLLEISQDGDNHPAVAVKMLSRAKDDPGTEKFMDYFYKQCIETLFKPFGDIPEFKGLTDPILPLTREKTNLYLYLCDLLCNFAQQHSFRSHFFVLSSNVSPRVASLLSARDKHLRLAAFRFFRVCLKLNNRNLINHLMKHDVVKPILDLTIRESRRDNLLSSSCQEFFEHIRRENIKDLIAQCMTKHEQEVRTLSDSHLGGTRFRMFIRRWEMNNEPPPPEEAKVEKPTPDSRTWGQGKVMDAEEEDYFNADDDDDLPTTSTPPRWQTNVIIGTLKRKRPRGAAALRHGRPATPTPPTPPLGSLVDYDDDDEQPPNGEASPFRPSANSSPHRNLQPIGSPQQPSSPTDASASPRLSHRQAASPKRSPKPNSSDDEDDSQDSLLERSTSPQMLAEKLMTPLMGPLPSGLSGKRRRDEEEEDGLLERISKVKRPSLQRSDSTDAARPASPKPGEDHQPKKFKVKLGSVGKALTTGSPQTPSDSPNPGPKDGDCG